MLNRFRQWHAKCVLEQNGYCSVHLVQKTGEFGTGGRTCTLCQASADLQEKLQRSLDVEAAIAYLKAGRNGN